MNAIYPQIYDRFILLDLLGSGGMGQVFRAVTLDEINRIVVVKKIFEHFRTNSTYARMFRDEIKVLSLLNHPNIVHMYNYGIHGEYLEMEYVRGLSIHQILDAVERRSERIPIEIIVYVCHEAAKALSYAHDLRDDTKSMPLNIVHRDISPHNLMLTYKGSVKVLDFGISKFSDKINVTEVGLIKGKRNYISPEQNRGQKVGPAADIYSLGAVLWRLLTGRAAFDADNPEDYAETVLKNKIPPPSQFNSQVPKSLDDLCLRAMNADPEQRLFSMGEFQSALLSISKEVNRENSIVRKTSEWMQSTFKTQMLADEESLRTSLIKAHELSKEHVANREKTVALDVQQESIRGAASIPNTGSAVKPNPKKWIYAAVTLAVVFVGVMLLSSPPKSKVIPEVGDRTVNNEASGQKAVNTTEQNGDDVISNLQLLVEQGSYQEALTGLSSVPAKHRLGPWRDIAGRAAIGNAKQLQKTNIDAAFGFLQEIELKFPFLVESQDYQNVREDIAMKWFLKCAPNSLECIDPLISFAQATPQRKYFAFQLGVKTTFYYFHYSGLPFFKIALSGGANPEYCRHDRFKSAVDGGESYGEDTVTGKMARELKTICQ